MTEYVDFHLKANSSTLNFLKLSDLDKVHAIELGMKFRVEGNPIVPKFTTYNWSGYHSYSAGVQYNIQVKKYELNSLT